MDFTIGKDFIETKRQGVYLRVEAWSKNAIRVRATLEKEFKPFNWVLCKKQKNLHLPPFSVWVPGPSLHVLLPAFPR